jgi:predicted dehydrogenase
MDRAQFYADEWHIPHAYGSYEDLLANTSIQVVYISLPNHLHTEWILKSLAAGKHILCEKPMCLTLDELDQIEKAMQATGLHVMEGFMHLYHPQTQLWKSIIQSGTLGEVHSIRSCFSFILNRTSDNHRWDAAAGGGALWDVGVYPISFMQYLLDESATEGTASMYMKDHIDLSTSAQLVYSAGKSGQFFVSFRSNYSTETIIHGSLGQLAVSHPYTYPDACVAKLRIGDEEVVLDVPREYLYNGEIENMHDIILRQDSPKVPFQFSRQVLQTLLHLKRNTS